MCGHEVGRPLQNIGLGHCNENVCCHLPKIPLVKVSLMMVRELINHLRRRENLCRDLPGKAHVPLWDPEDKLCLGEFRLPVTAPGPP